MHTESKDVDPDLMRRYIEKCTVAEEKSLETWSVAIVESPEGVQLGVGDLEIRTVTRGRVNGKESFDGADIKTLMSKEDRVADLGLTRQEARKASEEDLIRLRDLDPIARSEGLLVLYFIAPKGGAFGGKDKLRLSMDAEVAPVGIGVVFLANGHPNSSSRRRRSPWTSRTWRSRSRTIV
ncbi:hypothetical protein Q0F99_11810 [Rathayibacter oskolensis]|uniref:hypothetical protein n=1 Tax=Rathayibacter oskolensis TaxID=1891671 RepID=UPI00266031FF|nr:hypothetical protein [Rathayibacter oskolensis]WKK70544.1 hypothetical protein Q0F99_11810 [Rathayibacter oskolensis]